MSDCSKNAKLHKDENATLNREPFHTPRVTRPPLADSKRKKISARVIAPPSEPPAACLIGPRRSYKSQGAWLGGEILTEALLREGVETIFGIPGGVLLSLFDSFYEAPIDIILVRHEQGAGHMAEGYARATGRVGVAIGTSGPGATNLVTAITDAWMDSVPVVFLTGQVSSNLIGADAFQEADITGITRPITKHNYLVKKVDDLPRVIKEAFYLAGSGRRGPVLIDLPKDMLMSSRDNVVWPDAVRMRGYQPTIDGHAGQIKRAAELIAACERPLLYVGGGAIASRATAQLIALSEKAKIPVTLTSMGLGVFPADHPHYISMLGMHGSFAANMAVSQCDLLLAIGARFDDRVTGRLDRFASQAKKVHIDIDPTSVGKNVKVDVPIVGDAATVLQALLPKVMPVAQRKQWLTQIAAWKEEHPYTYSRREAEIVPQQVLETIAKVTCGECVYTTDVGQHQMWACQWIPVNHPHRFISSCGLGTMGFGFPAAIGAAFGARSQGGLPVVCITSDGSFQMCLQELAVSVGHRLPVKILLLNNGCLGMIRQWQHMFFKERYSCSDLDLQPDFVSLAEAYGASAARVADPKELQQALEWLMATPGTALLDVVTAREENVYPMVPAGGASDEMILDPQEAVAIAQRLGFESFEAD
ncbi:MAG: biosynthetic-type acetolactate synthase large subunit [Deltaproteobacteria bacterium]|nr:biosynthetic-type acetolactate synthase large subunit [Deltaproteobacteria bacterium]